MTVQISGAAASCILAASKKHTAEIKTQFVPVVTWIIQDSDIEHVVPRLGIGYIEESEVPRERWVECVDFNCRIGQWVPEDILARFPLQFIDLIDHNLVFVQAPRQR